MTSLDSCALLSCRLFFFRKRLLNSKFTQVLSAGRLHMDIKNEARSLANVPRIVSTYRHAIRTFDDKHKQDFATNLTKLRNMLDLLTSEDLALNKSLCDPATWKKAGKAPCTYIEVFQNSQVNMSIFVLKPGFKMPLHDHPHMHGFLKVISGSVNIKSYSEFPLKEAQTLDFTVRAKLEAARLTQGIHKRRRLFAEITDDKTCTDRSGTCLLTPTISNYHEITALDMPAAFFDILAPPYDTLLEDIGPRRCRYYHVVNKISTNLVELQETDAPECFYCDQAPYLGPPLKL